MPNSGFPRRKNANKRSSQSELGATMQKQKPYSDDGPQPELAPARDERPTKKQKTGKNSLNEENGSTSAHPITESKLHKGPKRPKNSKNKTTLGMAAETREQSKSLLDKIHITDTPVPYTNPLTDVALDEFSQRGLAYAYQHAQHISLPSDSSRAAQRLWKFNKGRQNWILRNVTNPATIPDPYLPLAMVYVDTIQGGARDTLKKACKATVKAAKATEFPADTNEQRPPVEASSPEENKISSKTVRFAPGTADTSSTSQLSAEKLKRAKRILKVLRGKRAANDV